MAVFVDATGEEVVHHALFDRLVLGDQGFRLLDQIVQCGQNPRDLALHRRRRSSDSNPLKVLEIETQPIIDDPEGKAFELGYRLLISKEVLGEFRVHAVQGTHHYVGGTDQTVFFGESTNALPHSHHVVSKFTGTNEAMLFVTEVRFYPSLVLVPRDQATAHRE